VSCGSTSSHARTGIAFSSPFIIFVQVALTPPVRPATDASPRDVPDRPRKPESAASCAGAGPREVVSTCDEDTQVRQEELNESSNNRAPCTLRYLP
jgi:hypothetical protein